MSSCYIKCQTYWFKIFPSFFISNDTVFILIVAHWAWSWCIMMGSISDLKSMHFGYKNHQFHLFVCAKSLMTKGGERLFEWIQWAHSANNVKTEKCNSATCIWCWRKVGHMVMSYKFMACVRFLDQTASFDGIELVNSKLWLLKGGMCQCSQTLKKLLFSEAHWTFNKNKQLDEIKPNKSNIHTIQSSWICTSIIGTLALMQAMHT